jgi:hypothetical protein
MLMAGCREKSIVCAEAIAEIFRFVEFPGSDEQLFEEVRVLDLVRSVAACFTDRPKHT